MIVQDDEIETFGMESKIPHFDFYREIFYSAKKGNEYESKSCRISELS